MKQSVKKIEIPWLNMIEIVSNKMLELNYSRPLILDGFVTTEKKVYSKYLPESVYLSESENRIIESIIGEIKIKNILDKSSDKTIRDIVKNYDDMIDSVLLGCTELPIVMNRKITSKGKKIISSIDEYIMYLL